MEKVKNLIVILLILTLFLTLGCLNSNEPTQKALPTNEPKVINLHAQQLILNDSEIKEALGHDWEKKEQRIDGQTQEELIILSSISLLYANRTETIDRVLGSKNPIYISVFVSPNIYYAENKSYQYFVSKLQETGKVVRNKIDVGDKGEIYTVVDVQDKENNGNSFLV
ncbi:MAG: hypothetical protein Q7J35_03205, partial [Candidatus Methanoperedens sp.]|nr:hypothetical protein [Candidatus Methanoperedens sp.]